MKVKISYELKQKILAVEEIMSDERGRFPTPFPVEHIDGETWDISFNLDLTEHKKLLAECRKWMNHIEAYFTTSYTALRTDLGPFKGVFPAYIEDSIVHFIADNYDPSKESWKDWFIVEDIKDAPQFIA